MTDIISLGRDVISAEIDGLHALKSCLDDNFINAVQLILRSPAYIIVVGVGKSGHIGQKLASTFASTGTPSFFMHPTEASHGDLGMVLPQSVILAVSNSGESSELRDVLHFAKRNDISIIGLTSRPTSTLGMISDIILQLPKTPEACPNGVAPTTSTTNMLALGDALAIAVMSERGFSVEDFGRRHPGGMIGLQLQTVEEWLASHSSNIPTVSFDASIGEVIQVVSKGGRGCVSVIDANGLMIGLITDGDLRRAMDDQFFKKTAADIMTVNPLSLTYDMKISQVMELFAEKRISNAFIVHNGRPVGVIDMKSLLEEGYLSV